MYQQQPQQQEQHGYWVEYMQATWTQHDRPWKVYFGRGRQEVGAYATEAEALADADASNAFDARMQPDSGARRRQLEAEHTRLVAQVAAVTKAPRLSVQQWAALDAWAAIRVAAVHTNTARSLVRRGLARRDTAGNYWVTDAGRTVLRQWKSRKKKRESHATAAR